ncbi:Dihydrolipoyllysine-residue acetyltransferase component of pyruvate dehydrogenase complex, mitochondrial [Coccomyxa sp. Obi]|nr:Dihydrolipoyllysine-residue acetyltransferase component of pyruvate dehydrogenase complex, mitochondrial [Coccomyxa sp. Obi]
MGLTKRCAALLARTALQRGYSAATTSSRVTGTSSGAVTSSSFPHVWHPRNAVVGVQSTSVLLQRAFASGGLPPHTVLEMPALSPTMSQGNIAAWKKKEGEEYAAGDVLCEVETDKATMDWEAQDEGVLAKILAPDGTKDIAVGTPVAVIVDDAADVGAFKDYKPGAEASAAPAAAAKEEPEEDEQEDDSPAESSGGSGDYPPHTIMGLPALSPTMSQGNIAEWKKKEGDEVSAGDSIAEVETDKATMDWESQDDGYMAKLLVPDGTKDIPVGSPVAVFVEDQDSVSAFANFTAEDAKGGGAPKKAPKKEKPAKKAEAPAPPTPAPQKAAAPSAPKAPSSGGRVVASPYARKLAREAGVDIAQANGSGPGGRIVAADVQQLISSGGSKPAAAGAPAAHAPQQAEGDFTDIPNSQVRRITAQRLLESKTTIPHYYLTVDLNADRLLKLRAQLNESLAASGQKLSVNDFIIKASAVALRKVPEVNASWYPDFIRVYDNIDVSVAVQTPGGLMVPVVRDADVLGLAEISATVKELAQKAKAGKLRPEEYTGGTFSISNLGMYGISEFAAIINPPQAAILAVGTTQQKVVAQPGGGFAESAVMAVTMSCDHRVVDGALGAQWLQAFRGYIEDPATMLL